MDALQAPLFTTDEMARAFSARARLQGMLDFERALARAQAGLGLVPEGAAGAIAAACDAGPDDLETLGVAAQPADVVAAGGRGESRKISTLLGSFGIPAGRPASACPPLPVGAR